jgi:hypothetical protein
VRIKSQGDQSHITGQVLGVDSGLADLRSKVTA